MLIKYIAVFGAQYEKFAKTEIIFSLLQFHNFLIRLIVKQPSGFFVSFQ